MMLFIPGSASRHTMKLQLRLTPSVEERTRGAVFSLLGFFFCFYIDNQKGRIIRPFLFLLLQRVFLLSARCSGGGRRCACANLQILHDRERILASRNGILLGRLDLGAGIL